MVQRTAKHGWNVGGKFWGCSRFPNCRMTRPLANAADGPVESRDAPRNFVQIPQRLAARSLSREHQVRFFQSTAVPFDQIQKIVETTSKEDIRCASQWRLDFRTPSIPTEFSETVTQVLGVADKMLTRGYVTCVQQEIEDQLRLLFQASEQDKQKQSFLQPLASNRARDVFDSPEEKKFYEELLPELLGHDYSHWVLPQAELTSLAPATGTEFLHQSVDFLICKPPNIRLVVEIDGEQHKKQVDLDTQRRETLRAYGYAVFCIPVDEVRACSGAKLDELREFLRPHRTDENLLLATGFNNKLVLATRYVHAMQIALLQAVQVGILELQPPWKVTCDLAGCAAFCAGDAEKLLNLALVGLGNMLSRLMSLYGVSAIVPTARQVHLSFFGSQNLAADVFDISSIYVPFDISAESLPTRHAILAAPRLDDIRYFLGFLFRKTDFWQGQAQAIIRILEGKDVLALLPTGAGKSIAFQLASIIRPGCAIVVAPILSLMDDQIENLESYGICRVGKISSQQDPKDRGAITDLLGQAQFLLCYVSPERFLNEDFRDALRGLTVHTPVALVAVDEAHCVSEWGHDFRTAYLNIGRTAREFCSQGSCPPPVIGLTGTASRAVLRDIQRELKITDFDALITPATFDRRELEYHRIQCASSEKVARLKGLFGKLLPRKFGETAATFFQLRDQNTKCGIVFCPHVNGEYGVTRVAHDLIEAFGIPAGFYSGSAPKGVLEDAHFEQKSRAARDYKRNRLAVLVATKAFGMGIDKPNVRYTVHLGLPASIESFYQEAGRAGRDRSKSLCTILVSDDNPERTQRLLSQQTSIEEVAQQMASVGYIDHDDVTRALWFHVSAFRGIERELNDLKDVITSIGDFSIRRRTTLRVKSVNLKNNEKDDPLKNTEKAIHRLVVLGVVSDYTINYSSREFTIYLSGASQEAIVESYKIYLSGYLRAKIKSEEQRARALLGHEPSSFVLQMCELLLKFIYQVVEQGRRRALWEMLTACTNEKSEEGFRARILRYLEETVFSADIERILGMEDAGLGSVQQLFDEVASPNQAAELRGQVGRYLESYPDHPGLLILRCLAELYSQNSDTKIAEGHFFAAMKSLQTDYATKETELNQFITWALTRVADRDRSLSTRMTDAVLARWGTRTLAREIVGVVPGEGALRARQKLLSRLLVRIRALER